MPTFRIIPLSSARPTSLQGCSISRYNISPTSRTRRPVERLLFELTECINLPQISSRLDQSGPNRIRQDVGRGKNHHRRGGVVCRRRRVTFLSVDCANTVSDNTVSDNTVSDNLVTGHIAAKGRTWPVRRDPAGL
jgi:hypothetical protein